MTQGDCIEPDPHACTEGLRAVFDSAWSTAMDEAAGRHARDPSNVLAVLFEVDVWRPWLGEALRLLSQAEQIRVKRKMRLSDRDELALAYGLHRLVLGNFLQCDPAEVPLERDALGRPFVRDSEVGTSLSHAQGAVAVAVTLSGCVGIDMESAMRAHELPGIASSVMHFNEVGALSSLPEDLRAQALLALWVRKEALLKASGIGLIREMPSFEAPHGQPIGLPAADGTAGPAVIVHMLEAGLPWVVAIAAMPEARLRTAWLVPGKDLSAF